jgi:hypothetical protein
LQKSELECCICYDDISGSDAPIKIQVPEKYMKLDDPKRANIMALVKDKLNQLESLNRELMCKLDVKSRYQQIKELMVERETERDIFCVGDECVVYQMRITDSTEEAHQLLEKYMRCVWKEPQLIARLMEKGSSSASEGAFSIID